MRLTIKWAAALAVVIPAVFLAACGGDGGTETTGRGVKVVATTTQVGALVREVAGDSVELTVLLPAGSDAHDFEPSPKALRKVHDAKVILRNGLGLDDWLDDAIEGAGGEAKVVTVTAGSRLLGPEDGDTDPHVWHDIDNVKVMLDAIAASLSAADPENAGLFAQRADAYKVTLDEADSEIRGLIDSIPEANRKMVTNHDAFGYFIDRYGLEFVAAVIPSTNKEAQASAGDLADLQKLLEREGVKVIFSEEEVDPKVARELARDTGVEIVEGLYADSLGEPGTEASTIHGMLLFNARKIAEALR
jgi:zinc/manganese transport system substrate-binding protein